MFEAKSPPHQTDLTAVSHTINTVETVLSQSPIKCVIDVAWQCHNIFGVLQRKM